MDSRSLNSFLQVLQAGGLTQASQRLHLTQSALSRQIRQLERELGVELFERTGRGLVPTPAGLRLEQRARNWLAELDHLREELAEEQQRVVGTLHLAVTPSIGMEHVVRLVRTYRERYPQVQLHLVAALSGAIQSGLAQGRLDLGLLHQPLSGSDLQYEPLWRERLWVVGAVADDLSPARPLALREVLQGILLLPSARHGVRTLLEAHASSYGLPCEIAIEVDSLRLLLALVEAGMGQTLLPAQAISGELAAGRLSAAPVKDPVIERTTTLAWAGEHTRSRAAIAMTELILEQMREPASDTPTD